ncbi:unnamed protein product, partial [Closterium sp. NIES-54]
MSSPVATSCFTELLIVSTPTCASLACNCSGVDFVAETIVRRATTSVDGDRYLVAVALQLHSALLQLANRWQVCLYAWNVEHVGDEDPLPDLPLQSDGSATLDRLQRPVESTHVLHAIARRHVDEDRFRSHQVVGATAVEQHRHRVGLHSCRHCFLRDPGGSGVGGSGVDGGFAMAKWDVKEGAMGSDEEELVGDGTEEELEEREEEEDEGEEGGEGDEEKEEEDGEEGEDNEEGDAAGAHGLDRLRTNEGATAGRSDYSESDSDEGDAERSRSDGDCGTMGAENGLRNGRKRRKGEGDGGEEQGEGGKRNQAKLAKGKKRHKTGVCYLSRIPPRMKPLKLRHLLSPYAEILRIYLTPEDPAARQRRRAAGGSRNKNFTEGWVEFARKRDAKRVAALLNGQPMGGKNRSHHRFDLWTIKYLKRFKWDNLSEEM